MMSINIRQLYDQVSSTYTYLLWDGATREALIIDPVKEQAERDIRLIGELELKLRYSLETHIHADHVTGGGLLRNALGCQIALHQNSQADCADIWLEEGDVIKCGSITLRVLHTPGHTNTDVCYLGDGMIFTGDTLLIRGSGRTDFQSGDAGQGYDSVTGRIFTLPDTTLIYPAHDYHGFTCSTVGEEKRLNPRLGNAKNRDEYIAIMEGMNLPKPEKMDIAVPGNQRCGL
jgi:sulfur dioxygenase